MNEPGEKDLFEELGLKEIKIESIAPNKYRLDLKGYTCPYPQIYTLKALSNLKTGDRLEVIVDNPTSRDNVSAVVTSKGNKLIGVWNIGYGAWKIVIEKS